MILAILRLLLAALLALTGVSAEDETLSLRGGVTETCDSSETVNGECITETSTPTPSELPGPSG